MIILPAIDIMGGKCVRLQQGKFDQQTIFSDDPVDVAKRWRDLGAEWIHIVDLDGAREGTMSNFRIVREIIRNVDLPLEFGGGIRDMDRLERVIELGVQRAVIGTAALRKPAFVTEAVARFSDRVAVGIDAKDGMVATDGWLDVSEKSAIEFAREMERIGVSCIVYTDISRDGMLTGVNIEANRKMAESVRITVIASGGVSSIDDIIKLKSIEHLGIGGVIIGKALYTGQISLPEAIERAR